MIVCILGYQKSFIAFLEFLPFNLFICKRLHHTDSRQRILQTGIDIPDLSPVVHKSLLHLTVLFIRKDQHKYNHHKQRNRQSPVDKKQKYERSDNFDHRYK